MRGRRPRGFAGLVEIFNAAQNGTPFRSTLTAEQRAEAAANPLTTEERLLRLCAFLDKVRQAFPEAAPPPPPLPSFRKASGSDGPASDIPADPTTAESQPEEETPPPQAPASARIELPARPRACEGGTFGIPEKCWRRLN